MNNEKLFFDSIGINDSGLHGFVILTDKDTGKILVKKHNLILNGGKEYVFQNFMAFNSSILRGSGTTYDEDRRVIKWLVLGKNINEPTFTDSSIDFIESTSSSTVGIFDILDPNDVRISTDIGESDGTFRVKYLKFKIDFDGSEIIGNLSSVSNSQPISELGLYLDDNDSQSLRSSEHSSLFSRIRFDQIIITNNSHFNLEYYIYF